MARIAGVNIPDDKHIVISLRYVYGIGPTAAQNICMASGIEPSVKVSELNTEQLDLIRSEVAKLTTEGDLRREVSMNIKDLWTLDVIEESGTDVHCRCEDREQKLTRGLERVPASRLESSM